MSRTVLKFRPLTKSTPLPCGIPFATVGMGVVNLRSVDAVPRAFALAFRDAERKAQEMCRTNPKCPDAAFINVTFINCSPEGDQIACTVSALWMSTPETGRRGEP